MSHGKNYWRAVRAGWAKYLEDDVLSVADRRKYSDDDMMSLSVDVGSLRRLSVLIEQGTVAQSRVEEVPTALFHGDPFGGECYPISRFGSRADAGSTATVPDPGGDVEDIARPVHLSPEVVDSLRDTAAEMADLAAAVARQTPDFCKRSVLDAMKIERRLRQMARLLGGEQPGLPPGCEAGLASRVRLPRPPPTTEAVLKWEAHDQADALRLIAEAADQAVGAPDTTRVSLNDFHRKNIERQHEAFAPPHSLMALVVCVQEEVGELAAAVLGVTGEKARKAHLTRDDVLDAVADAMTYLSLVAGSVGCDDLEGLLYRTFDMVSDRAGSAVRLGAKNTAQAPLSEDSDLIDEDPLPATLDPRQWRSYSDGTFDAKAPGAIAWVERLRCPRDVWAVLHGWPELARSPGCGSAHGKDGEG